MKKKITLILLFISCTIFSFAQEKAPEQPTKEKKSKLIGIGLKAGMNFSDVTGLKDISTSNTQGFMFGAYYAPLSKSIFGFRTEIMYSKQGFNYSTGITNGQVDLNYILLPQLTTIQITRFFEIHLGMQIYYLLNASVDSSSTISPVDPADPLAQLNSINDLTNKFGYGFVGGIQIYPISRVIIGARMNISMSNLYKAPDYSSGIPPALPGVPDPSDINLKNNVIQVFVGVRF